MTSRASTTLLHPAACAPLRLSHQMLRRHELFCHTPVTHLRRSYASVPPPPSYKRPDVIRVASSRRTPTPPSIDIERYGDGINPPRTTLPPDLVLPVRDADMAAVVYWFKVGRSYGRFYWAGVKATYANYNKAKELRQKIRDSNKDPENNMTGRDDQAGAYPPRRMLGLLPPHLLQDVEVYMRREGLTRSQFQLLTREREDVKKLPLFGILFVLFGEWLPLIVPWIPGRVPKTCRIPNQVNGMREAQEKQRRESFRSGVREPDREMIMERTKPTVDEVRKMAKELERKDQLVLDEGDAAEFTAVRVQPALWLASEIAHSLNRQQLTHLSATLGLHGKIWDRLGLTGDTLFTQFVLQLRVIKRLHYLNLDDELLLQDEGRGWEQLSRQEVEIACEDRGIDVLGRREEHLRSELGKWLENRRKDKGYGVEIVSMLFRRPNVW